ncbi:hypothetical protein BDZ45DRAFT_266720 [Acephala macrosclerotiorum]|nr:hypothetical protein BDZ45DRAFT_266720 [Acephala macrosclerotiorum]
MSECLRRQDRAGVSLVRSLAVAHKVRRRVDCRRSGSQRFVFFGRRAADASTTICGRTERGGEKRCSLSGSEMGWSGIEEDADPASHILRRFGVLSAVTACQTQKFNRCDPISHLFYRARTAEHIHITHSHLRSSTVTHTNPPFWPFFVPSGSHPRSRPGLNSPNGVDLVPASMRQCPRPGAGADTS